MSEQQELFDLPKIENPFRDPSFKPAHYPIWTKNKAKLIARYLFYFVLVTKHGTYIDGFAGPQEPDKPDTWAAKLVLESQPPWLRKFFLCDNDPQKFLALEELAKHHSHEPNRLIKLFADDFNEAIHQILGSGLIREKEATFCLIDQRTFECKWKTLETLARYKKEGSKIELFYFLGIKWLQRALTATQERSVLEAWWGDSSWPKLRKQRGDVVKDILCDRFKNELGYRYAYGWPIFEKQNGGSVMYFMIHASDHPHAPALMDRAYRQAVSDKEPIKQLKIEFQEWKSSQ
jgi:three-Cys-motif partner protein